MKKLILLVCMIGLFVSSYAQTVIDTAVWNKLSPAAKQEILGAQQTQAIEGQMASYSKIAGYGKEVGVAVREGLFAIKDVTVELSKTDVGKITMYLIVWKVAGKDIIRMGIGLLILFISIFLVTKSYFRTFRRRICIENGGLFKAKKYELVDSDKFWVYPNAAALAHVLVLLIFFVASGLIMFG